MTQKRAYIILYVDRYAEAYYGRVMSRTLLSEIEAFLAEHPMSGHRFGMLAIKNGRLVERLQNGGRVWPETEAEVRAFMRVERQRRSKVAA